MKSIDIIQGSDEWLELRRNHITATDAVAIMGLSPWTTPYRLWREKLQLDPPKPKNEAMQRGSDMELPAREYLCGYLQRNFIPLVVFHKQHSWMMASLDAITFEKDMIVEIKCPGKKDHELAKKGKVPDKYYPQLQHQMEVCDLDEMLYMSFDGVKGILIEVKRNSEFIIELLFKENIFRECMVNLTAPEMTESDYAWEEMKKFEADTDSLDIGR